MQHLGDLKAKDAGPRVRLDDGNVCYDEAEGPHKEELRVRHHEDNFIEMN